jgi:NTE family protein
MDMPRHQHRSTSTKPRPRVVLALQGGGALGAYQAGVYQALHENGVTPDWVVGTSIGAINAALIVGNEPNQRLDRLRQFWRLVSQRDLLPRNCIPGVTDATDLTVRFNVWNATAHAVTRGISNFFAPRFFNPFAIGLPVAPERASFYDTAPLAATLRELVDIERINDKDAVDAIRLTVSSVKVTTAELVNFDSRFCKLGIEHILASGAIPPGFPPVRIDGDLYWDGGLFSNTPLETVLDDTPRADTLCFMIDLWFAEGLEPNTYDKVQARQKAIMFASRSKRHIEAFNEKHALRRQLRTLYEKLPPELQRDPEIKKLSAGGCNTSMHVVRLQYTGHDWHTSSKDINFSAGSIEWRWQQGYSDAQRALARPNWQESYSPEQGIVVQEICSIEDEARADEVEMALK